MVVWCCLSGQVTVEALQQGQWHGVDPLYVQWLHLRPLVIEKEKQGGR